MRPRLVISFSGGRTSALMTKYCVEQYSETHDVVVTFANTGLEEEATLDFVNRCDKHFGWNIVWIEAEIRDIPGLGPKPMIVTYDTASRDGEPFRKFIEVEGLPNMKYKGCSARLKAVPIKRYVNDYLGWDDGTYKIAIGIRADEIDRMDKDRVKKGIVYPLIPAGITEPMVKTELETWPFDLELNCSSLGNCKGCFKKSNRKHDTQALETPHVFDFWLEMEHKHAITNVKCDVPFEGSMMDTDYLKRKRAHIKEHTKPRRVFRGQRTARDIIFDAHTTEFRRYRDADYTRENIANNIDMSLDAHGDCEDSCEAF